MNYSEIPTPDRLANEDDIDDEGIGVIQNDTTASHSMADVPRELNQQTTLNEVGPDIGLNM